MDARTLAAIDIGTNSIRLKIARPRGEALESVHQARAPVRPGEGVFGSGVMKRPVIDRLAAALGEYAAACRAHRARVRAVATSALREAANRAEVLAELKAATGVEVEVISGREEARLICL